MSVFDPVNQYERWPSSKFQEPQAVQDGIRVAMPMEDIASCWWSRRWFEIIDEFGLGVRWERAKLYASRGQVQSIEIDNGLVKAFVQGSADEPYRVTISVKTIPTHVWTAILKDLGRTSAFAISLVSRVLPSEDEISRVFRDNGALLFPDRQGELHTKCTCIDWSNPCKHIAAVYLILGAQFNRDPFLLFKLRGLDLKALFALSAATSGDDRGSTTGGESAVSPDVGSTQTAALPASPTEIRPQPAPRQFWKMPVSVPEIAEKWSSQQAIASLPESLGDFPFWRGREKFLDRVRHVYEAAPESARKVLTRREVLYG